MRNILDVLKENYKIVEDMGLEVVGVFLQGSQNYELDYENSDIDCKAIVLPKFEDIILNNKLVSTTHVLENKEHTDIKDIRLMFDCFRKQNINFVEILFTKYKVLNPKYESLFQPLLDNRELVARYNNYAALNCMVGMSFEKHKALEHPYPSIIDKIEKYGYDPKQLHHIIRVNEFIKRYINGVSYEKCLIPTNKEYLINVKKGCHTLEEARLIANEMVQQTLTIKNNYMQDNKIFIDTNVHELLNNALVELLKLNFKTEWSE